MKLSLNCSCDTDPFYRSEEKKKMTSPVTLDAAVLLHLQNIKLREGAFENFYNRFNSKLMLKAVDLVDFEEFVQMSI